MDCDDAERCTTSLDCPSGMLCTATDCCAVGHSICVAPCGADDDDDD
jgi:hypothetical protein